MKFKLLMVGLGIVLIGVSGLRADEVQMQNGDRYFGKIVSVSPETVVMDSEILGKITVPRKKVTSLALGNNTKTNVTAQTGMPPRLPLSTPANTSSWTASVTLTKTNDDLAAALRALGTNTNFISQIRNQLLAGQPEASAKFNQMVGDLLSGKLDLTGLRQQAQSSVDQIRELKRELGPDTGGSLDPYLQVLEHFLQETTNQSAGAAAPSPPKTTAP